MIETITQLHSKLDALRQTLQQLEIDGAEEAFFWEAIKLFISIPEEAEHDEACRKWWLQEIDAIASTHGLLAEGSCLREGRECHSRDVLQTLEARKERRPDV